MVKVFLCALVFLTSGCFYINGGEAKSIKNNQYSVTCIADEAYCYDIARDTCRGDFVVINHTNMQLLVSCKQSR